MAFITRAYPRFSVRCPMTYHAGLYQGAGTISNLSLNGWRFSGDVPMRIGQTFSMTVLLSHEESLFVVASIVRWRQGEEYGAESLVMSRETQRRLEQYIDHLTQDGGSRQN
ncbi:MAG TPA: PilZ domain-containing protein [Nitrospiraceae bacterium]